MLDRPIEYITANNVETILQTLEARPAGTDRWRARCPAHGGQSLGSLSIALGSDGRILLKCWAGCPASEILSTMGLSWGALFSDSETPVTATAATARMLERSVDSSIRHARLFIAEELPKVQDRVTMVVKIIAVMEMREADTSALRSRLGDMLHMREFLGRAVDDIDSRDKVKALGAVLAIRQRGRG